MMKLNKVPISNRVILFVGFVLLISTKCALAQSVKYNIDSLSNVKKLLFEDEADGSQRLTHLPLWVKYCVNVEEVVFYNTSHLKVSSALKILSRFPQLRTIEFRKMNLRVVPKNISLLKNISVVDFSQNPIRKISKQLAECKKIRSISLSDCSLQEKSLVLLFTAFPELTYLSMQRSNIHQIPEEICVPPLSYVNFYDNNIEDIPSCLYSSDNLRKLLISNPSDKKSFKKASIVATVKKKFLEKGNEKVEVN